VWAFSFLESAVATDYSSLEEFQSAVEASLRPKIVAELRTELASMFEGVRAIFETTMAGHRQAQEQFKADCCATMDSMKASIPAAPDLSPFHDAIGKLVQLEAQLAQVAATLGTSPKESPALIKVMKSIETMCEKMDQPKVREGTAELPSGGTVKLRLVEKK
jgi:hypothetical protein